MLGAIPFLDGGTYSFDTYYRRSFQQIAKASGHHIIFNRTGNIRYSDPQYRAMCSAKQLKEDRRTRKQWEVDYPTQDADEYQRISESLKWMTEYQVKSNDLPCFIFTTQHGKKVGLLRIRPSWYVSESSWRAFLNCFCDWLGKRSLINIANADSEIGTISKRLSRSLRELTHAVEESLDQSAMARYELAQDEKSPVAYYQIISNSGTRIATRKEYDQLHKRCDEYDLFIDAKHYMGSYRGTSGKLQSFRLTSRENEMLVEYFKSGEDMRPRDTSAGKRCTNYKTANRIFECARRKVDVCNRGRAVRIFTLIRSPEGAAKRCYRFTPPTGLKYVIITSP